MAAPSKTEPSAGSKASQDDVFVKNEVQLHCLRQREREREIKKLKLRLHQLQKNLPKKIQNDKNASSFFHPVKR